MLLLLFAFGFGIWGLVLPLYWVLGVWVMLHVIWTCFYALSLVESEIIVELKKLSFPVMVSDAFLICSLGLCNVRDQSCILQ